MASLSQRRKGAAIFGVQCETFIAHKRWVALENAKASERQIAAAMVAFEKVQKELLSMIGATDAA